jgi:glycosyltransferase involved in cell wall biosynthesis
MTPGDPARAGAQGSDDFVILNQYYAPDIAATGNLLAELAQECASLGRRVFVVTAFPSYGPRSTWKKCSARERTNGVEVTRLRTTRFRKDSLLGRVFNSVTFLLPLSVRMLCAPSKGSVFMYTSNPPYLGVVGALVSLFRRHRYVLLLHDSYPHIAVLVGKLRAGSLPVRAWHRLNRLIYHRAERTIVLCERARELIISDYGVDPARVHVIHNWADPRILFPVDKERCRFAEEHGYRSTFTVLYSGNIGLYYEFDTLLDAARILSDDPDFRLVFVGSGGRRAYIERRVAEFGLRNVDFHQYQPFDQLNDSRNSCDASLVTIARGVEGISFPSKFYSSLAIGKPVLALSERGSELEHLVRESGCGLWSQVGDGAGLARNIRELRANRPWALEMGQAARRAMERSYTVNAAARNYLKVIDLAGTQHPEAPTS